jgi:hypothetical protein
MGLRITGAVRQDQAGTGAAGQAVRKSQPSPPWRARFQQTQDRISTERQGWPGTRWQQSSIVTTKTGDDGRLAFKIAPRLVLRRGWKVALSETEKPVTLFPNWSCVVGNPSITRAKRSGVSTGCRFDR